MQNEDKNVNLDWRCANTCVYYDVSCEGTIMKATQRKELDLSLTVFR